MPSTLSAACLRLAHLIESDGPGGAERVVADLASEFQARGATNVVFLPARGDGWLARQLRGTGVTTEHFWIDRPFSPPCARALAARFRHHRIDLAHSHEFSMAVYGAWGSWLAGVHHVITMHGSRYYAARLRRRLAMRAAVGLSGRTVAVSHPLADHISTDLHIDRARIDTILNGVRATRPTHSSLRAELRLERDDRLIVSVGNLYPVKGHHYLIEALHLLGSHHQHVHLAICGRGDKYETLVAQARTLGLIDRIHLLGLRADVPAVLAAADVFVLPSLSEGLPLALLEAMFAGCPIVASDVGDVSVALAQKDAGMLVPPGDAAALASALDLLLNDPTRARQLGERARRRASAEFDVSHMVRRYRAVYDDVLGRPTTESHVPPATDSPLSPVISNRPCFKTVAQRFTVASRQG